MGASLTILALLTVGLPAQAASDWTGKIDSFTASRTVVDPYHSESTLRMTTTDFMAGTAYQMTIYDDTNTLVADCTEAYTTACSATIRVPFKTERTFTAYVSEGAPGQGPPNGVAVASAPVTVSNPGWTGEINSFTASPTTVSSGHTWSTLRMTMTNFLYGTPYQMTIYDDDTNALVGLCTETFNTACNASVTVPYKQSHSYTAYVSEDAPSQGPPHGIATSAGPITVTNVGWIGKITSFTAPSGAQGQLQLLLDNNLNDSPNLMTIYNDTNTLIAVCYEKNQSGCNTYVSVNSGSAHWYRAYVSEDAPAHGPPTKIVASAGPVVVSNIDSSQLATSAVVATLTKTITDRYGDEACLVLGEMWRTHEADSTVPDVTLVCNAKGIPATVQFIVDAAAGAAATAAGVIAVDGLQSLIDSAEGDRPANYNPDCDHVGTNGDCLDEGSPDSAPEPQPDPAGAGGGILPPSSCLTAAEKAALLASMGDQVHHVAPWQNQDWTPRYKRITDKYNLDLNDPWNKITIKHAGPHPKEYHQWVLDNMEAADRQANGDATVFQALFKEWVTDVVRDDPTIVRLSYWKCYRS